MVFQVGRTTSAKALRQGCVVDRVNMGCTCTTQRSRSLTRTNGETSGETQTQSTVALPQAPDHRYVQTALTFKPSSFPISQAGWRAEARSSGTPLLGPLVLSQGALPGHRPSPRPRGRVAELQAVGGQAGMPAAQGSVGVLGGRQQNISSLWPHHATHEPEPRAVPGAVEGQQPRTSTVGYTSPRPAGIKVFPGSQRGISPSLCDTQRGTLQQCLPKACWPIK